MDKMDCKCFKYGPEPAKGLEMHYPGIPERTFDAVGATKCYRDTIHAEHESRAISEARLLKLPEHVPPQPIDKIGGFMPGFESVHKVYEDLGYEFDPFTSRMIPPHHENPVYKGSSQGTTPLRRSMSSFKDAKFGSQQPTPLDRSMSSFKDAKMNSSPMTRSLTSFKTATSKGSQRSSQCSCCGSKLREKHRHAQRALPVLNEDEQMSYNEFLQMKRAEEASTGPTPLQRSQSTFKNPSGNPSPVLRRSVSSFQGQPTKPIQSLSSILANFNGAAAQQSNDFGLGGAGRSGQGNMVGQMPLSTHNVGQLPEGVGPMDMFVPVDSSLQKAGASVVQQPGSKGIGAALPPHHRATYMHIHPREIQREIQAHIKGVASRKLPGVKQSCALEAGFQPKGLGAGRMSEGIQHSPNQHCAYINY